MGRRLSTDLSVRRWSLPPGAAASTVSSFTRVDRRSLVNTLMLTDTKFRKSSPKGSYRVLCSDIDQYTRDKVIIEKIQNIFGPYLMLPGSFVRSYLYILYN